MPSIFELASPSPLMSPICQQHRSAPLFPLFPLNGRNSIVECGLSELSLVNWNDQIQPQSHDDSHLRSAPLLPLRPLLEMGASVSKHKGLCIEFRRAMRRPQKRRAEWRSWGDRLHQGQAPPMEPARRSPRSGWRPGPGCGLYPFTLPNPLSSIESPP